MKVRIQVTIESELRDTPVTEEVACIQREDLAPETLGMTMAEAKDLLAHVQASMAQEQTREYIAQQRPCPHCGKVRSDKGQHRIVFRSLFGKLSLPSPRLYTCSGQPQEQQSLSPLAQCLPERTAPEWLYLQKFFMALNSISNPVRGNPMTLTDLCNIMHLFRGTYDTETDPHVKDLEHLPIGDSALFLNQFKYDRWLRKMVNNKGYLRIHP